MKSSSFGTNCPLVLFGSPGLPFTYATVLLPS